MIQTARGAAFVATETAKQRRADKLRRRARRGGKRRDEADAAIAEKNAARVAEALEGRGRRRGRRVAGSGVVAGGRGVVSRRRGRV